MVLRPNRLLRKQFITTMVHENFCLDPHSRLMRMPANATRDEKRITFALTVAAFIEFIADDSISIRLYNNEN